MKPDIEKIKLDKKIILITGAGDGIGQSIALECAKRGATIVLLGKTIHKLEKVYDQIKSGGGSEPAIYPLDLAGASPDDYTNLANAIQKEFGRLDGLVNNAGWLGASSPIANYDIELWYKVMQVNLNAPFLLTRACIPLLKNASPASIAFTADDKSDAYWGAYGVAKSGINSLTLILAKELKTQGIKVNAFNPGPVHTNFRTRAYPAEDATSLKLPSDIALPYIYLLSDSLEETGKIFNLGDF